MKGSRNSGGFAARFSARPRPLYSEEKMSGDNEDTQPTEESPADEKVL